MNQRIVSFMLALTLVLQLCNPLLVYAQDETQIESPITVGEPPATSTSSAATEVAAMGSVISSTTGAATTVNDEAPVESEVLLDSNKVEAPTVEEAAVATSEENDQADAREKASDMLKNMIAYYNSESSWGNLVTLSYMNATDDKLTTDEKSRTYSSRENIYNAYQGTIRAVALGNDPRSALTSDGERVDFISIIEQGQSKTDGKFNNSLETNLYILQAAKMGQASIDEDLALEYIKSKLTDKGDTAQYGSTINLNFTADLLLALTLYPDNSIAKEYIPKCVKALKAEQKSDATFGTSRETTALVARALLTAGEDILSGDYVKGTAEEPVTIIDALSEYQISDGSIGTYIGSSYSDDSATEETFALLSEMKGNESMYQRFKAKVGTVASNIKLSESSLSLIAGKSKQLSAKAYDSNELIVPSVTFKWHSNNPAVATVEDGLVTAIANGNADIVVSNANDDALNTTIKVVVEDEKISKIEIISDKKITEAISLLSGTEKSLEIKAYNQADELITISKYTTEVAQEGTYFSVSNLTVQGITEGVGTLTINVGDIKKEIQVSVISISELIADTLAKHLDTTIKTCTYIELLTLKESGISNAELEKKINLKSVTRASDLAENIISVITVGKDPNNYNGKNLVSELVRSQNSNGYFDIGYKSDVIDVALPIIALEMASANYDKASAISIIHRKAKSVGQTRVCDSDYTYSKFENTSYAIIALSFSDDESDITLRNKMKDYVLSKLSDDCTLKVKENYYSTREASTDLALAILALAATGENPFGEQWTKSGNTLYDGLLTFELSSGFKYKSNTYSKHTLSTQLVLLALNDMSKKHSSFHINKIKTGDIATVVSIEIADDLDDVQEKTTLYFNANAKDAEGLVVPSATHTWSIEPSDIGTISNTGELTINNIESDKAISVEVVSENSDGTNVKAVKSFIIHDRVAATIDIDKPYNFKEALKTDESQTLTAVIKDSSDNQIDYLEYQWTSSDDSILSVDDNGKMVAKKVSEIKTATLTATCNENPLVKATIDIQVLPIIPSTIVVKENDTAATSLIKEAERNFTLKAFAYELDGTLIPNLEISWKSSNPSVATVIDGRVELSSVAERTEVILTASIEEFIVSTTVSLVVTPRETTEEKITNGLSAYNDYFKNLTSLNDFEILVAGASKKSASIDVNKLDIQEVNYKSGYSGNDSKEYGLRILSLLASGNDPFDDDGKNTVKFLGDAQNSDGIFLTKTSYYDGKYLAIAYAILALDASGGDYNSDAAIKALMDEFTVTGDKAYTTSYPYGDYFKTGIPLMALANHKDISGVKELLEKGGNYLSQQFQNEQLTSKQLGQIAIVLDAIGTSPDTVSKTIDGNDYSLIELVADAKEKNAYVYGALLAHGTEKSLYQMVDLEVGEPTTIKVALGDNQTVIKTNSNTSYKLTVTDPSGHRIKEFDYSVESTIPDIVSIDKGTQKITALKSGVTTIKVTVLGTTITQRLTIEVVDPKATSVELNPVSDDTELVLGERLKFIPRSLDEDGEISPYKSEWEVVPSEMGVMENDTFISSKNGDVTLKYIVTNKDLTTVSKEYSLNVTPIIPLDEKVKSAINSSVGNVQGADSYDYMKSLALRNAGIPVKKIQEDINIYSYGGVHNTSRNVMTLIGANLDPSAYKENNRVKGLEELNISGYSDQQYYPKVLVAMDMTNSTASRTELITQIGKSLKVDGEKRYIELSVEEDDGWGGYDTYTYTYPEETIWAWIALSSYSDQPKIQAMINGIENYVIDLIDENGLVDNNIQLTSLAVQGILSNGLSVEDEKFCKYDLSGNKRTLIDGILLCKKDKYFTKSPDSSTSSYTTEYAISALSDYIMKDSTYNRYKYVEVGMANAIVIESISIDTVEGDELLISAIVTDKDGYQITDAKLQWSIEPLDAGAITTNKDNSCKLTLLKPGELTVKVNPIGYNELTAMKKIDVRSSIDKDVIKKKLDVEIEFFKTLYNSESKNFEYLASPAAKSIAIPLDTIKDHQYHYSRQNNVITVSKQIVALVGADKSPRSYQKNSEMTPLNLVDLLITKQQVSGDKKGQFAFRDSEYDSLENQAMAIIALDMARGNYNKEFAVDQLINLIEVELANPGKKATENLSYSLIALSQHRELDSVDNVIERIKDKLKSFQNEDGGFDANDGQHKNSPIAIGLVTQGLVAVDENPLYNPRWINNRKTMLDALLTTKHVGNDARSTGYYQYDGFEMLNYKALYHAFAAMADLYNDVSMFKTLQLEDKAYEPTDTKGVKAVLRNSSLNQEALSIYVNETTQLEAFVLNTEGSILENYDIVWTSKNEKLSLTTDGQLKTSHELTDAVITATMSDNASGDSFSNDFKVTSVANDIVMISLDDGQGITRVGDSFVVKYTAKDAADISVVSDQVRYHIVSSSEEGVASIDEVTGMLTALKAGTVDVQVSMENTSGSVVVSKTLEIKVIERTEKTVYVSVYGVNSTGEKVVKLEEKSITVDNFNLGIYGDGIHQYGENPYVTNALIKRLEMEGFDCKDNQEFDVFEDMSFISGIDGLKREDEYDNSGWKCFINNKYVPVYLNKRPVTDGDIIRVFYVLGNDKDLYTNFQVETPTIGKGKDIKVTLVKSIRQGSTYTYKKIPMEGFALTVNGKPVTNNGQPVITDKNGNALIPFNEEGSYTISADVSSDDYRYVPPVMTVTVKDLTVMNGIESVYKGLESLKSGYESSFDMLFTNMNAYDKEMTIVVELYEQGVLIQDFKISKTLVSNKEVIKKITMLLPDTDDMQLKIKAIDTAGNIELIHTTEIK